MILLDKPLSRKVLVHLNEVIVEELKADGVRQVDPLDLLPGNSAADSNYFALMPEDTRRLIATKLTAASGNGN